MIKNKKNIISLFIILIFITILYLPVLTKSKIINGSDLTRYFYFYRLYMHNYFQKNHSIPTYEPYTFGGRPFIPVIQNAIAYPLTYLPVFFNPNLGINLEIVFSIILSALFMFLLVNHWLKNSISAIISAIIFSCGGFAATRVFLGHLTIINALPYLPLMFYSYNKIIETKKIFYYCLIVIAIALQFFAGQPQFLFYSLFSLFLYHIYNNFLLKKDINLKKFNIMFIMIIILSILSTSFILFPTAKFTINSVRNTNKNYSYYTYWSFEPKKIITTILPFFYGSSLTPKHPYWRTLWRKTIGFEGYNAFISLSGLILILISLLKIKNKDNIFLWSMLILSLLISLGKYTFVYKFFHYIIPGFKLFRWPVRFMYVFNFFAAILAGIGWKILKDEINLSNKNILSYITKLNKIFFYISGGCLLILLMYFFSYNNIFSLMKLNIEAKMTLKMSKDIILKHPIDYYSAPIKQILNSILYSLIKLTILLSLIQLFLFGLSRKLNFFKYFIIIILLTEFYIFQNKFIRLFDINKGINIIKNKIDFILKDKSMFRIYSNTDKFPPGINMAYNILSVNGYEPFILKKYDDYVSKFEKNKQIPVNMRVINPDFNSNLFNNLSIKYIFSKSELNVKHFSLIKKVFNDFYIYKNNNFIPMYHIKENKSINIKLIIRKDNYLKFKVINPLKKSTFILNYINYPGWQVIINGKKSKLIEIDNIFIGTILTEKNNIIEFKFKQKFF